MSNSPPLVEFNRLSVVVFDSTAPLMGHFADVKSFEFVISFRGVLIHVLKVEEVVVKVDIDTHSTIGCHVEFVRELKV